MEEVGREALDKDLARPLDDKHQTWRQGRALPWPGALAACRFGTACYRPGCAFRHAAADREAAVRALAGYWAQRPRSSRATRLAAPRLATAAIGAAAAAVEARGAAAARWQALAT